jgi:hypothetical protein
MMFYFDCMVPASSPYCCSYEKGDPGEDIATLSTGYTKEPYSMPHTLMYPTNSDDPGGTSMELAEPDGAVLTPMPR